MDEIELYERLAPPPNTSTKKIIKVYTDLSLVKEPILEKGENYIYILQNYPQGYIKIGITHNIQQRLNALSGSNGGGNIIVKCAISPSTYLYSIEKLMHSKFEKYRVKGTEWFFGKDLTFDDVYKTLEKIFNESDYEKCNRVRKTFIEKHGIDTPQKKSYADLVTYKKDKITKSTVSKVTEKNSEIEEKEEVKSKQTRKRKKKTADEENN